ncbi:unnamed protein product [Phytophthora fragariaefolia]|uniref:Unnamed protein product n=1 Tax=Phytophthora fragariaefolia TaxID=1490495 RepID=A0A9W6YNP3_9STRA|nr:unnamed protein product [Phytophthora fragariaefolia]
MASAILSATVEGHGYMSVPKVEFAFVGDTTQYMATIDASTSGFSGSFGGSPTDNTANFNKGISASKYSSLKEFMNDKMVLVNKEFTKECGYTNPDEAAQPVWCDDTRVFQDDNCPKNFPTAPAKLPYDHDACLGSSRLTIYWIALHSASWQVYINCAALEKTTSTGATSKYAVGGSSGGATSNSTTPATESSSSAEQTPEAPTTPTTEAPSAEQTTDAPSTPAMEAPTTDAPSTPATEAPTVNEAPETESPVVTPGPDTSGDTSKCSVRRHRRRRN